MPEVLFHFLQDLQVVGFYRMDVDAVGNLQQRGSLLSLDTFYKILDVSPACQRQRATYFTVDGVFNDDIHHAGAFVYN